MNPVTNAPLTPAGARSLFPALERFTYLNAAASSPLAAPVEAAAAGFLRETAESGDAGFPRWLTRKDEIRSAFARFIGAAPTEVAFLPTTSFGFSAVADQLWQLGVRQVVTLDQEFPSTTLPLLNRGLGLTVVRARPDGSYSLEDVERAIDSRCGAVVASAIQYASGFRLDLAGLSSLCARRRVFLAVNAAQALGQIPLDVTRTPLDFLCATSHKWMMGGFGVGLYYARRELLERTRLPWAGWLSMADPMAMDNLGGSALTEGSSSTCFEVKGAHFRSDASALEAGVGSFAPLFGFGAALDLIHRVGIDVIERHNAGLQRQLREGLRARGFQPNAPDDQVAGTCVFKVAGDPRTAVAALAAEQIAVTPRGGGLRVATHVFNDESDLERLFAAFADVGLAPSSA